MPQLNGGGGDDLGANDEMISFKDEGEQEEKISETNSGESDLADLKSSLVNESETNQSSSSDSEAERPPQSRHAEPYRDKSRELLLEEAAKRQDGGGGGAGLFRGPPYPGYPFFMFPDLGNPYLANGSLSPSARSYLPLKWPLFDMQAPLPGRKAGDDSRSPSPAYLISNKVPVVQSPHHVHPLAPILTYGGERFVPGTPPPIPTEVDPKTGLPRPGHTPELSPYYPLSPGAMGQIPHLGWQGQPLYPLAGGFRPPYPTALVNSSMSSFLSGRYPPHMVHPSHGLPPTGIPHPAIVTPPVKQEAHSGANGSEHQKQNSKKEAEEKKPHIKKPLNAFMLFMKEMRAKVIAECTLKESAAINQILGRRWHALSREEQAKYYELARKERQLHSQLYPGWSARDNYGKKKKRKREKQPAEQPALVASCYPSHLLLAFTPSPPSEQESAKKCRARYGVDQQNNWCSPCRRKKKCARYPYDDDSCASNNSSDESMTDSLPGSPARCLSRGRLHPGAGDHPHHSPATSTAAASSSQRDRDPRDLPHPDSAPKESHGPQQAERHGFEQVRSPAHSHPLPFEQTRAPSKDSPTHAGAQKSAPSCSSDYKRLGQPYAEHPHAAHPKSPRLDPAHAPSPLAAKPEMFSPSFPLPVLGPRMIPGATSLPSAPPSHGGLGRPLAQPAAGLPFSAAPSPFSPGGSLSYSPTQHGGYSGLGELSARMQGLALQRSPRDSSGMPYDDMRPVDLLQERFVLPPTPMPAPRPRIHTHLSKRNCSPEVLRSTLMNLPQSPALLAKAKLPLGLVLHPFKDLAQLPVITSSVIVRCRSCRTYINPFVAFIDQRRWRCNICYRINDAPEEFMYNPVTRSYGEPQKRPEVLNSTVEFIAPSEYMLRPPQPAVYLFLFDVSYGAIDSGYLSMVCESLLENLDRLPGDSRTKIGFVTFDSSVHFYQMHESLSQPHMLVVPDIDDVFIPTSEHLLVNLQDRKELVRELVRALPERFRRTHETRSALGPALQAAHKLVAPTGGRVTVFQTQLPNLGHGALQSREDPNVRASTKNVQHLRPGTDFYKKLALDCSGHQIAVDLFLLSGQYADLATLACVSRYSSGTVYFYPSFHRVHTPVQVERLEKDLQRYLTRKIGFEAVMRIRCSKGVSIHTFHGNFFVRSTDLLSLPNVNPDAGFAVQMSIDETLTDTTLCSFQAALLYTSSKGDRRIRVHTLCLPVVNTLAEIYHGADVQAIMGLLATMAVERSVTSSLPDARDALVNAVADSLSGFRSTVSNLQHGGLVAPRSLSLLPLYVHALLKHTAFRLGTSTRLDERVFAMCQMKSQPLVHLMPMIHPHLYRIDNLMQQVTMNINDKSVPQPPILQLSSEHLNTDGAFLLDCGSVLYIWVGRNCSNRFIKDVLGFPNYISIPNTMVDLPELDNTTSERTRDFLSWIREPRPFHSTQHVIKDDSTNRTIFIEHLVEDRSESSMSYSEFLQHIQRQICK
ncbi:unnamed protein product [Lampetra planeri]